MLFKKPSISILYNMLLIGALLFCFLDSFSSIFIGTSLTPSHFTFYIFLLILILLNKALNRPLN